MNSIDKKVMRIIMDVLNLLFRDVLLMTFLNDPNKFFFLLTQTNNSI